MPTLILDRLYYHQIDVRAKKITREKEKHYIMIKGSTHHENIALNNSASK